MRKRCRLGKPYPEITLHLDGTPEEVAQAMFKLNPNAKGFEWQYLKDRDNEQLST